MAFLTSHAQTTDISLTDNGDGTWTPTVIPDYNVKLVVEYEDILDFIEKDNGKWTLGYMPDYNVKMVVEYEDESATGIEATVAEKAETREAADVWYTIDGRRLMKQPEKKGIYINSGRKVVVR
jgi:hypothetical protein